MDEDELEVIEKVKLPSRERLIVMLVAATVGFVAKEITEKRMTAFFEHRHEIDANY